MVWMELSICCRSKSNLLDNRQGTGGGGGVLLSGSDPRSAPILGRGGGGGRSDPQSGSKSATIRIKKCTFQLMVERE